MYWRGEYFPTNYLCEQNFQTPPLHLRKSVTLAAPEVGPPGAPRHQYRGQLQAVASVISTLKTSAVEFYRL